MTNSIVKGKDGEREFANFLKDHGYNARRSKQYCGANGDADVICEELPFHFEVKRVEKLNLDKAMKQAQNDCKEGLIPIVAHRKNGQKWNITISAENFFRIYKGEV